MLPHNHLAGLGQQRLNEGAGLHHAGIGTNFVAIHRRERRRKAGRGKILINTEA